MRKIFKYPVEVSDEVQKHEIPRGATDHHVGIDPGDPSRLAIWFVVDTDRLKVTRELFVKGTGQAIPEYSTYMGTVVAGIFAWHVFEVEA